MKRQQVTRGFGFLENFLARKRAKFADSLVPNDFRKGRILDIGCGHHPYFLINIDFAYKYGLEKETNEAVLKKLEEQHIQLIQQDIEINQKLSFADEYFDTVTMLAVVEHIKTDILQEVFVEVYRILKPNGLFIITTPAIWTNYLLKIMAKLHLVSPLEIKEHKKLYSFAEVVDRLNKAGFSKKKIKSGTFEFFANIWFATSK